MIILVKKWRKLYRVFNRILGRYLPIYEEKDYISWFWVLKMSERELATEKKHHEEIMKLLAMATTWQKKAEAGWVFKNQ